jgi:hypothetical protein
MNTSDEKERALDETIRAALGQAESLPKLLDQSTLRRARGALLRPGEGTLSIRGAWYFTESAGMATLVLLAGFSYAVIEAIRASAIYGG